MAFHHPNQSRDLEASGTHLMGDTHLTIVSICLDEDPFKTRLDVMDVVTVLQVQREEGTREQFGSIWKVRAQCKNSGSSQVT